MASGSVKPGCLLAIDPGGEVKLPGYLPVKEPAFGFNAYWVPEDKRDMAELKGLTMVDCATVITTHLSAVAKRHAADILTRQDVSTLLEHLKETHPTAVLELLPAKMGIGSVHRVLQGLLREKVSIRDMAVIVETLSDYASKTQDVAQLVEYARRALGPHIARSYVMPDGSLKALGLFPDLENMIKAAANRDGASAGAPPLHPALVRDFLQKVQKTVQAARSKGFEPIILCAPAIRPLVRQLIMHSLWDTAVLSFAEIPDSVQVEILELIPAPQNAELDSSLNNGTA